MTKQEEIREGLNRLYAVMESDGMFGHDVKSDACMVEQYKGQTQQILEYLHSQGVVIKVDSKLPTMDIIQALEVDITDRRGLKSEWHMIDDEVMAELKGAWAKIIGKQLAGYEAIEPLIKE